MNSRKHETIAGIVSEMLEFAETDSQTIGRDVLRRRIQNFARRFEAAAKREALVCDLLSFADRIEAAHQREVGELCGERNGILNANASLADDNDRLRREVAELERKVSELRECLKETMVDAVAEYKNNSCFRNVKCGEIEKCDTCKVMRWRKVLKGVGND